MEYFSVLAYFTKHMVIHPPNIVICPLVLYLEKEWANVSF